MIFSKTAVTAVKIETLHASKKVKEEIALRDVLDGFSVIIHLIKKKNRIINLLLASSSPVPTVTTYHPQVMMPLHFVDTA